MPGDKRLDQVKFRESDKSHFANPATFLPPRPQGARDELAARDAFMAVFMIIGPCHLRHRAGRLRCLDSAGRRVHRRGRGFGLARLRRQGDRDRDAGAAGRQPRHSGPGSHGRQPALHPQGRWPAGDRQRRARHHPDRRRDRRGAGTGLQPRPDPHQREQRPADDRRRRRRPAPDFRSRSGQATGRRRNHGALRQPRCRWPAPRRPRPREGGGCPRRPDPDARQAEPEQRRCRRAPDGHQGPVEPPDPRGPGAGHSADRHQSRRHFRRTGPADPRRRNRVAGADRHAPDADRAGAEPVPGDQPRLRPAAGRHRPRHHVRRDGRHQHGAWRDDHAGRLYHRRRAAGLPRTDPGGVLRPLPDRIDPRRLPGRRRRRRRDGARHHPLPLRPPAGNAAGDLGHQPDASAVWCARSSARPTRKCPTPAG